MDFEEYKKSQPGSKFSDYYVYKLAAILEAGEPHGALGKDLSARNAPIAFEEAGLNEFGKYLDWFNLTPEMRVVDFGCGSLRLGLHFIKFLSKNHYFGLDLTTDFIAHGVDHLNELLGDDWDAKIGTIDKDFDDAVNHKADFVVSSNVAYHIHPDEWDRYFERLSQLASKHGSTLCFDSRIAREYVQFGDRNFAYPLEFHTNALPNFKLVRTMPAQEKLPEMLDANEVVRVIFHFERI